MIENSIFSEEQDVALRNFIIATYATVKSELTHVTGSVGILEEMLKYAKRLEHASNNNFTEESFQVLFEIYYEMKNTH